MRTLGICSGMDTGCTSVEDGKIIAAVNEERLNRRKLPPGLPRLSIKKILKICKINPSYYNILKGHYKLTGIPSRLNTSFDMHEEPIVCTPYDAIRSFRQGHLDYLAIGNYSVSNLK
ncbi:hypothetical protein HYW20_01640 [Candidatus Woesearchaeota archaeon]|nr:hypothetical protein [Candidatus Woesearchaeota archaeon]